MYIRFSTLSSTFLITRSLVQYLSIHAKKIHQRQTVKLFSLRNCVLCSFGNFADKKLRTNQRRRFGDSTNRRQRANFRLQSNCDRRSVFTCWVGCPNCKPTVKLWILWLLPLFNIYIKFWQLRFVNIEKEKAGGFLHVSCVQFFLQICLK
jgi:hypothetical protein